MSGELSRRILKISLLYLFSSHSFVKPLGALTVIMPFFLEWILVLFKPSDKTSFRNS